MKALVAYFSASGVTRRVAETLAEAIGADCFEIVPEVPYTAGDLNWMNPASRCNREKFGKKDVPIDRTVENMADYDVIFLGFPIWYFCEPNIINTFLKGYDLTGKKIAAFATSGGSGVGKTAEKLKPYAGAADIVDAVLLNGAGRDEMKAWAEKILMG